MATQKEKNENNSPAKVGETLPKLPPMAFKSIGDFKAAVSADISQGIVVIQGVEIPLPKKVLDDLLALGLKRSFDTNSATEGFKAGSDNMPQFLHGHLNRLLKGYMSKKEEEKSISLATSGGIAKGKQSAAFGRFEIVGKMADLATSKSQNEAIVKIQALDDSQWSEYVKVASLKPDSLLVQALTTLTNEAAEKAKKELAASEASFDGLLI